MDPIGRFITTLHSLRGHDTAAAIIGVPAGNKQACLICAYEREPSEDRRLAVVRALAPRRKSAAS